MIECDAGKTFSTDVPGGKTFPPGVPGGKTFPYGGKTFPLGVPAFLPELSKNYSIGVWNTRQMSRPSNFEKRITNVHVIMPRRYYFTNRKL